MNPWNQSLRMLLCTITIFVSHTCNADFISLSGHIQCLGCDLQGVQDDKRIWSQTRQGLQLSVYVSNTVYTVGGQIVGSVAMRNSTDLAIEFPLDSTLRTFEFSVVRFDGTTVPLTDYGRGLHNVTTTAVNEERLSPQKVLIMGYALGRAFDLTKPDKYLITARYRIPKPNDTNLAYVVSNTVTVEVTAASSGEPKSQ